jgi:hypothetical protein
MRLLSSIIGLLVLVSISSAFASSWDNTYLVQTEAFTIIDDGAPGSNIYLTFGDVANESLFWNIGGNTFEFTNDVHVQQSATVSGTVIVDGNVTLNDTITIGGLTYNFPTSHGSPGDVLINDGSGTLVWGPGVSGTTLQPYLSTESYNNCRQVYQGSTANTINIFGGNFDPLTVFDFGPNFTITSVQPITHEQVAVTFDVGAATGTYPLDGENHGVLHFGSGAITVLPGASTTLVPGISTPWVRISADAITGAGTLTATANVSGWDKGASFETVPAARDMELTWMIDNVSNTYGMFGVDNADPNHSYTTIDYALYLRNGNVQVRENGAVIGDYTTYVAGDTFQIKRRCGVITYHKNNGNAFYTSAVVSNTSLVFDSSIYRNSSLSSISITY